MSAPDRPRRVGLLLQRELALLMTQDLNDTALQSLSLTDLRMSPDLKRATAYISSLDDALDTAEYERRLNRAAGHLARKLARKLALRHVPRLEFRYDSTIAEGARMNTLINRLNHE